MKGLGSLPIGSNVLTKIWKQIINVKFGMERVYGNQEAFQADGVIRVKAHRFEKP